MSWDRTYSHNVLYGLDCLGAILFWNQPDMTISALCRVVQLRDETYVNQPDYRDWNGRLGHLNLWGWQIAILRWLAPLLDKIQADHCELARQADIARAWRTLRVLQ